MTSGQRKRIDFFSRTLCFGPGQNVSTTIGWIAMTSGADVHAPVRMNCNHFRANFISKLNLSYILDEQMHAC